MIEIKTSFSPLRLVLSRKEPVQMKVWLKNRKENELKLIMRINLEKNIAFDKAGLKNQEFLKIDSIKAGEEKAYYYDIFPKSYAEKGEYSIQIKVEEFYKGQEYSKNEYIHKTELIVC